MPRKPTLRSAVLTSMARAVRDKLLHDVGEAITEFRARSRREEEESDASGLAPVGDGPMLLAQRRIRHLLVAACRDLAHLAIAHGRRDPRGWAEAEIHELEDTIAEEYRFAGFDLDKTLDDAIDDGLHQSSVLIAGAVRTVPLSPVPRPPVRSRQPDERKLAITQIKAGQPGISSRDVCVVMDKRMERVQSDYTRRELAPLADWKGRVHPANKGTWVGLYDDPSTRNLVKSYINKCPPLATRKA